MGEVVEQPSEGSGFPFEANRRAVGAIDHLLTTVQAVRDAHLDARHAATVDLAGAAAGRFTDGLADRCVALGQLCRRLQWQLDDLIHDAALAHRAER